MRAAVATLLLAVLVFASGCSGAQSAPNRSPQPGGLSFNRLTFDGPRDADNAAEALREARKSLGELTSLWYEYDDTKPDFAPASPQAFARETTLAVVPVFEYSGATTGAASIYDITRPTADEYVLLSFWDGELVAACDWYRPGPDEIYHPGPWFSFYELGGLGYPEAIAKLQESFAAQPLQLRVVRVPRGWWVVGRASAVERAVFVQHQGSYDDDPRYQRVYSLEEVLAYGAPHAHGN